MVVVVLKCVNLAKLREFLKMPFLVYSGLRWARREILVGDLEGEREAAGLLLLTHTVTDLLVYHTGVRQLGLQPLYLPLNPPPGALTYGPMVYLDLSQRLWLLQDTHTLGLEEK